ncbi:hypothetical protein ALC57_08281 [Trachymyrmex cornetzi]|uniref:Uncharacterized protein n=1 Tax=Trachymyrmex cornetzi TaxID=471704 RepID=A0A151J799_9HYME|nr:hypothetical protein ALC57_08281 [Trachymyrmex cornetzi]
MDGVNTAKLFEAMEVEFEDMVDDTECRADVSDNNADHAEKFVQSSKIRALTSRTKHCIISCYYTERCNDAPIYCAMCMIELRNIVDKGMYLVRNHKECSFFALDFRWSCHKCGEKMYIVYPCNVCPFCTHKKTIEKSYRPARYAKIRCILYFHAACAHSAYIKKLFSAPCKSASASCKSAITCFAWLQRCDECIEQLEELCRTKRPRLAVGQRQSAVARIARLAGAKSQLERRFMHVGGEYAGSGYARGNERDIVLERVRDAVERHGSVKVNTAFNGEFATKDKRDNKSIITKNSEIYRCTDTRE